MTGTNIAVSTAFAVTRIHTGGPTDGGTVKINRNGRAAGVKTRLNRRRARGRRFGTGGREVPDDGRARG